ncbi:MAG: hypothetical protein IPK58_25235 [Acidobacteria bacterium]|nr:hypothetical protein [Acidobacteriota bacterium]
MLRTSRAFRTRTSQPPGFALRVIADHARTTAFAIADGILPGNEGRNYVLRKIMRRAIYYGREHLGFEGMFFNKVCDFVVDQMKEAYPELEVQRGFIGKMVRLEEERFGATLTVGLKKLAEVFDNNESPDFIEFAKLYDTFGTPRDLIRVSLEHRGIKFEKAKKFDDRIQLGNRLNSKKRRTSAKRNRPKDQSDLRGARRCGLDRRSADAKRPRSKPRKVIAIVRNDIASIPSMKATKA